MGEEVGGDGWLFEVPVTVVKPEAVPLDEPRFELSLAAGLASTHRHFYTPPAGASWVDVTLTDGRAGADDTAHLMALHLVQLQPGLPFRWGPSPPLQKLLHIRLVSRRVLFCCNWRSE